LVRRGVVVLYPFPGLEAALVSIHHDDPRIERRGDPGLVGCGALGDYGRTICIAPAGHAPNEARWASIRELMALEEDRWAGTEMRR
jgi:hypothetical protein